MTEREGAAIPRPASTLVLLRPAAAALPAGGGAPAPAGEVYLLRRADSLRFAPGYHVFPGGAVDPEDGSPEALALLDDPLAPFGGEATPGVTPAHVVSALRECFEEAGVLLARDADGRPAHADPARVARLAAARAAGEGLGGTRAFLALLRREGLRLDGGALRYFAHWITPPWSAIRFDTRFFLAWLPEGAEPAACGHESADGAWWTPQAALAGGVRGPGMALMAPTRTTLRFLAQFGSFAELAAHCDDGRLKLEGFHPLFLVSSGSWPGTTRLTASTSRGPRTGARRPPRAPRVVLGMNPGPFTGKGTNTYLVGDGRPVLIDTGAGVPAYAEQLAAALAGEAGPLALVLVTHHHRDHQGGLAQVGALAPGVPLLKRPHPKDLVAPDRPLEGGGDGRPPEAIELDGVRLVVLYTPGHASDHLCFYWKEARALFTGDLILGGTTTVIPADDGDLSAYLASLERLLALDLEVLYPGHGDPIREPHARIREYLAHRRMREAQVVDALRAGLGTPAEIAARIYPDISEAVRRAARDQVLAHLVKLERDGVAVREPAAPGAAEPGAGAEASAGGGAPPAEPRFCLR